MLLYLSFLARLLPSHAVICVAVYLGCLTMPAYQREQNEWPFYARDWTDREVKERAYFAAEARNEEMNRTFITAAVVRSILIGILAVIATMAGDYWTTRWDFSHGDSLTVLCMLIVGYLIAISAAQFSACIHAPARICWVFCAWMTPLLLVAAYFRDGFPAFLRRLGARRSGFLLTVVDVQSERSIRRR